MTGVTSTNASSPLVAGGFSAPAAPAATPAAANTVNFGPLNAEIKQFLKNTMDISGKPVVGLDTLAKAREYRDKINDAITKSGAGSDTDRWPEGSLELLTLLRGLHNSSLADNQAFAKEFYADNPQLAGNIGKALENPLNPENLPAAAMVFATKPKWEVSQREKLTNQREQEALLAAKNQELELIKKREAEKDVNIAKLKADMDTMNAKFAEFTKQQSSSTAAAEAASKRLRLDTSPIMNTGLSAAELAAAKGQQPPSLLDVGVAVGASQGTRSGGGLLDDSALLASFGSGARVNMHADWLQRFSPPVTKNAEMEGYKNKVFFDAIVGGNPEALGRQINSL